MLPLMQGIRPQIARTSVLLPAPLAPMIETLSPSLTSISTSKSTGTFPYPAASCRVESTVISSDTEISLTHAWVGLHMGQVSAGNNLPKTQRVDGITDAHQ